MFEQAEFVYFCLHFIELGRADIGLIIQIMPFLGAARRPIEGYTSLGRHCNAMLLMPRASILQLHTEEDVLLCLDRMRRTNKWRLKACTETAFAAYLRI